MDKRSAAVRLLIADDHPIFREGLRRLLEAEPDFEVVGEAVDGVQAVRLVQELQPDILLLDLAMPRLPGLEALRELTSSSTRCRVVVLTVAIDKAQIVEALQFGARGVVLKEATTTQLFKGIRTVLAGQYWVGRESVSDLVEYLRQHTDASPDSAKKNFGLTHRELQIVTTIVAGCTNKDIAKQFSLSEDTVKHHLSHVFDKLGVSNRLELALFAIHHRMVDNP